MCRYPTPTERSGTINQFSQVRYKGFGVLCCGCMALRGYCDVHKSEKNLSMNDSAAPPRERIARDLKFLDSLCDRQGLPPDQVFRVGDITRVVPCDAFPCGCAHFLKLCQTHLTEDMSDIEV